MGIIKNIRDYTAKRLLDLDETDWALFGGLGGYRANDLVGQRDSDEIFGYYRSWFKTGVDAIGENVAQTEFILKKGGKKVDSHEILTTLKRPNNISTKSSFLIRLVAYLIIAGKAPVYKELGKKSSKLVLLPPKGFTAKWNDTNTDVARYENRLGNKSFSYEPETIIPIFSFNPDNPADGFSTARANAYGIETMIELENWIYQFFSKGGIPPFAVIYDQKLNKDQVSRVKDRLLQEYSGSNNAFAPMVLSGGAKMSKTGLSPKDVELSDTERAVRDKVLGQLRVPKAIVGAVDDVNRANLEGSTIAFMQYRIKPMVTFIVELLNAFWVSDWGEDYELGFVDPVPEDRLTNAKVKSERGKWVTINELREEEGLERVENGDIFVGQSPISINMDSVDRKLRRLEEKMESLKIAKGISKADEDDAVIKMLDRQAKAYEGTLNRSWASYANGLEDRIIKSIKSSKSIKVKQIATDVYNQKDEIQIIVDILQEFYENISREAILDAIALVGYDDLDFDRVLRQVIDKHTPILAKTATKISKTLKDRISSELIKGLEAGEGIDGLIERVKKNTTWMKESQAESIAQTETTKVTNSAFFETYKSGNAPYKEWVNLGDGRVRDSHENENIGELVVGMEDNFLIGSELMQYPGDPSASAENVIRCRCRIIARYDLPEKSYRQMSLDLHKNICGCGNHKQ